MTRKSDESRAHCERLSPLSSPASYSSVSVCVGHHSTQQQTAVVYSSTNFSGIVWCELIQAAVSQHCQLVLRHRRGRMASAAAPITIPGCDKMSPVSRRVRNGSDSSDNGCGSSCSGSGTNSPVYFGRTSPGTPAPKVGICQYFLASLS